MVATDIATGLTLITGTLPDLMTLVTTFPVNLFAVMLVAGLAIAIVRKLIKLFKRR